MYGGFIDVVGVDMASIVLGNTCHDNGPHEFTLSQDSLVTSIPMSAVG